MASPYVGEIRIFGGNFNPSGWARCDGSLLPISENESLFDLIGTTYGGDGQDTFALPNLVSRIPFGDGGTRQLAESGGEEQVTITPQTMASHAHPAQASTNAATSTTPTGNVWAASGDSAYSTDAPDVVMDPAAVAAAGGSDPHENRPPLVAMTFIISLFGIFPFSA
jgi:microcystin-dependent protein